MGRKSAGVKSGFSMGGILGRRAAGKIDVKPKNVTFFLAERIKRKCARLERGTGRGKGARLKAAATKPLPGITRKGPRGEVFRRARRLREHRRLLHRNRFRLRECGNHFRASGAVRAARPARVHREGAWETPAAHRGGSCRVPDASNVAARWLTWCRAPREWERGRNT